VPPARVEADQVVPDTDGALEHVPATPEGDGATTKHARRPERDGKLEQLVATRETRARGGRRTLVLAGDYDITEAQVASRCALDVIREGCRDLELDLTRAELDARALILLLLRPSHWMSRRNGRLRVRVAAGQAIEGVLAATAVADFVEIARA
jgi:hypothetical protein